MLSTTALGKMTLSILILILETFSVITLTIMTISVEILSKLKHSA